MAKIQTELTQCLKMFCEDVRYRIFVIVIFVIIGAVFWKIAPYCVSYNDKRTELLLYDYMTFLSIIFTAYIIISYIVGGVYQGWRAGKQCCTVVVLSTGLPIALIIGVWIAVFVTRGLSSTGNFIYATVTMFVYLCMDCFAYYKTRNDACSKQINHGLHRDVYNSFWASDLPAFLATVSFFMFATIICPSFEMFDEKVDENGVALEAFKQGGLAFLLILYNLYFALANPRFAVPFAKWYKELICAD